MADARNPDGTNLPSYQASHLITSTGSRSYLRMVNAKKARMARFRRLLTTNK